jgi:serine/threonine-protein kinase
MLTPGSRLGSYELIAPLRAGGMATLWLGRRAGPAGFSRHVAIKIVHPHLASDPSFVRMFLDEARLAARIQHANVVHTEELGEASGMYYLAMEYVHGCTLSQLVQRLIVQGRGLSTELSVFIAMKVADGLHAAHEAKDEQGRALAVVHRDVSPQNVLLSYTGQVKLIDFGVAKAEGRDQETTGSSLKGKIRYMSPEQAWGRAIDRRTDVYALGIVLWECLTHLRLFAGGDDFAALERVRAPNVARPSSLVPSLPPALDQVVLTALALDPSARFQTAQAFRRALGGACPAALAVEPDDLAALTVSMMADDIERERRAVPAPAAAAALEVQAPDAKRRTGAMQALTREMPAVALEAVEAAGRPSAAPTVAEPSGVQPTPLPTTSLPPTLAGIALVPASAAPAVEPPAGPSGAQPLEAFTGSTPMVRWPWVAAIVLPALAGAAGGIAWKLGGDAFDRPAPSAAPAEVAGVETPPAVAPPAPAEAPASGTAAPTATTEATATDALPTGVDEDAAADAHPRRAVGARGPRHSAHATAETPSAAPPAEARAPAEGEDGGTHRRTPFISEPTF